MPSIQITAMLSDRNQQFKSVRGKILLTAEFQDFPLLTAIVASLQHNHKRIQIRTSCSPLAITATPWSAAPSLILVNVLQNSIDKHL
jgi:hypothetical protein